MYNVKAPENRASAHCVLRPIRGILILGSVGNRAPTHRTLPTGGLAMLTVYSGTKRMNRRGFFCRSAASAWAASPCPDLLDLKARAGEAGSLVKDRSVNFSCSCTAVPARLRRSIRKMSRRRPTSAAPPAR